MAAFTSWSVFKGSVNEGMQSFNHGKPKSETTPLCTVPCLLKELYAVTVHGPGLLIAQFVFPVTTPLPLTRGPGLKS